MILQEWLDLGKPVNSYINCDNMDLMEHLDYKEINLCIVDPPYGIDEGNKKRGNNKGAKWKNPPKKIHHLSDWDKEKPKPEYFLELFRVSENQIIWGGNYFVDNLHPSMGWIFWDKKNGDSDYSDGELAWTSFHKGLKKFSWLWNGFRKEKPEKRIHSTQKPVALYRWLLQNYARPRDLIFDSHVGSASSLIACIEEGFNYIGCEKDIDYYNESCERIETFKEQGKLF